MVSINSLNKTILSSTDSLHFLVMELAVIIAAGLRDWIDFGVIIGILFLNAAVGWYQEKQAADVVASLKGDIAMKATVIRGGQEVDIKAREIVPGDIVSSTRANFLFFASVQSNNCSGYH